MGTLRRPGRSRRVAAGGAGFSVASLLPTHHYLDRGYTLAEGTIESDLTLWSSLDDLIVGGNASGYTLNAGATVVSSSERLQDFPTGLSSTARAGTFSFRAEQGTKRWLALRSVAADIWVDTATGTLGNDPSGVVDDFASEVNPNGGFNFRLGLASVGTDSDAVLIRPTDANGSLLTTMTVNDLLMTISNFRLQQLRTVNWADSADGKDLFRANTNQQPLYSATAQAGKPGSIFDVDVLQSTNVGWEFLHDGTPCELIGVYTAQDIGAASGLFSTSVLNPIFVGTIVYFQAGGNMAVRVQNGSGTALAQVAPGGMATVGPVQIQGYTLDASDPTPLIAYSWNAIDGYREATVGLTGVPSPAAPLRGLTVGVAATTNFAMMTSLECAVWNGRRLSTAERQNAISSLANKWS